MLYETNKISLDEHLKDNKNLCVLAYTSMCGTCEQAKLMLNIVSEAVSDVLFLKININLNQTMIKEYNFTSIPCFLIFKSGKLIDKFYAFHSVTFLYDKIKQIWC